MPIELTYLIWSVALFFVMIMVQAFGSDREHGLIHNAGPRDGSVDKGLFVQRAKRANQNMIEALMMFAPLALIGVPWVRSAAWFVSIAGILMILWELLF